MRWPACCNSTTRQPTTCIGQLVDAATLPGFVQGRYFDVLAANSLARALSPTLQPGQNRLTSVFLDPAEKALPDWDKVTAGLVASFRGSVGSDTDDPRFVRLTGELSLSSERFRYLWARQDVQSADGPMRFRHPQAGELTLSRTRLAVTSANGQFLIIYHAQPGTSSAEKLALLAALVTGPASGRG